MTLPGFPQPHNTTPHGHKTTLQRLTVAGALVVVSLDTRAYFHKPHTPDTHHCSVPFGRLICSLLKNALHIPFQAHGAAGVLVCLNNNEKMAGKTPSRAHDRCRICKHWIWVPETVARGVGSVCLKKAGGCIQMDLFYDEKSKRQKKSLHVTP